MLMNKYPHSILQASGPYVGLPEGQMGTSEVGHMNIGSGRVAMQPLETITASIEKGDFFENKEILEVLNHVKSNDSYYYKDININGKKGYIDIKQVEDKFLIDFMYNYAHVESLVKKEDINKIILNSSYILSTVKFNNNVIRIMLNEDYFKYKEEKFQLFENDEKNENFLEYSE